VLARRQFNLQEKCMKTLQKTGAIALLLAAAAAAQFENGPSANGQTLVVTSSNATANQLLVYNTGGQLLQTIATQGKGGASGNAGGIEASQNTVAVVNFGSNSVSLFERFGGSFRFTQMIPSVVSPVSVAFGNNHLYILGATKVESHQMFFFGANANPDGVASLLKGDGSAAQVGVLPGQLIITEKSNFIETVSLRGDGAVTGPATLVANIPANVNTPFGLVTRGNDAYVTIAHANEISLVRNGAVLTVTGSGTQMSPCWLALDGPFLFSSNSPSMSISRYAVYGQKIVQDLAVAASLGGDPTDIAHAAGLVAVIDSPGSISHLSIFSVDEDGNLALKGVTTINGAANGVAIVPEQD
jgi:hypothetical protein